MAETLMNISNPYVGERRPGAVGFPLPGVSVQVRDRKAMSSLRMRAANSMFVDQRVRGLLENDAETRRHSADGYFRTGDIGTRSTGWILHAQGSRSDLIISGGFNIYPREIEEFLTDQAGITEAAVAGVPIDVARYRSPGSCVMPPVNIRRLGSPLPRRNGFVQDPSRIHPRRIAAPNSPRQDPETPAAARAKVDIE